MSRELFMTVWGFTFSQSLASACKLRLFEILADQPALTVEQLAKKIRIPLQSVRALMQTMSALGLTKEKNGRFSNSPTAIRYLLSSSRTNILAWVEAMRAILYQPMAGLEGSLRSGRNEGLAAISGKGDTLYERLAGHPELEKLFHEWMGSLDKIIDWKSPALASAFSRAKHVIDVGGGPNATNSVALVEAYPHIKVTVMDFPSVCKLGAKAMKKRGLDGQIDFSPGDYRSDPFPKGADTIMLFHVLNIYSDETNVDIAKRAFERLPKGGKVVCHNLIASKDHKENVFAAGLSMYFLAVATGEGFVYGRSDYQGWYKKFSNVRFPSKHIAIATK